MNVEKVLAVADAIEKGTINNLGFDMAHYRFRRSPNECGTFGCIAGWTLALFRTEEYFVMQKSGPFFELAQDELQLSKGQALDLFTPELGVLAILQDVSRPKAVKVLRHLAVTGVPDWSIVGFPEFKSWKPIGDLCDA